MYSTDAEWNTFEQQNISGESVAVLKFSSQLYQSTNHLRNDIIVELPNLAIDENKKFYQTLMCHWQKRSDHFYVESNPTASHTIIYMESKPYAYAH